MTLRAATYMCPDFPVELYEAQLHLLESRLQLHSSLLYESRWRGPCPDRPSPFAEDLLDIAWMDGQSYLRLAAQDPHATLIPVAPAYHDLPLNTRGSRAGHLVNVIIHKDNKAILEYFTNLRGYKWAYDREESFTGHFYTLHKLRQMGENANFFSNIASSGSQRGSIQMVRDKIADAAAVDAACLNYYLEKEPDSAREELHILETWGPFSPYPLVANSRLPENVRNKIAETLLELHTSAEGRQLLSKFGIKRFLPISPSDFAEEKSIVDPVKDLKFKAVYY